MERKTIIKIAILVIIIMGFMIFIYFSQQSTPIASATAQTSAPPPNTFNSLSTTLQTSAMILASAVKIQEVLALAVFL